MMALHPESQLISAAEGQGIRGLLYRIAQEASLGDETCTVLIPFERGLLVKMLHERCQVIREQYAENGLVATVRASERMDAIPVSLRHAISVGLGLFIAMIGLSDGGIITANSSTMVSLGDVFSPTFIVGLISIVATVVLYAANVRGSLLIGIVIAVLAGIPLGVTSLPTGLVSGLDFSSFGAPFLTDANGVMGHPSRAHRPALSSPPRDAP